MLHALEALARGERTEADRRLDAAEVYLPKWKPDVIARIVRPFMRELDGERGALAASVASLAAEHRWTHRQRIWHQAMYLLGTIDEQAFLGQPNRSQADAEMLVLRAMRREVAGRRAEALADWRAYLAKPTWRRSINLPGALDSLATWRIAALEIQSP
ncbi:MAG: hypothetical protein H0W72_12405 [Planctomycetes bacterium]|nr:hypothetical protein [Planctomycetota bacterium]